MKTQFKSRVCDRELTQMHVLTQIMSFTVQEVTADLQRIHYYKGVAYMLTVPTVRQPGSIVGNLTPYFSHPFPTDSRAPFCKVIGKGGLFRKARVLSILL
jgi:hypothetical protein